MQDCPCGSGQTYEACCEPYLLEKTPAPTAEALMRSRYTAFTRNNVEYLRKTLDTHKRRSFNAKDIQRLNQDITWLKLTVLSSKKGTEKDETGEVEFEALFEKDGVEHTMHEYSRFKKKKGAWYYVSGKQHTDSAGQDEPIKHASPKVGRNDPCPCGSGKKFKKCCA